MDQIPSLRQLAVIRLAADVCIRPDVLNKVMEPSPNGNCCNGNAWINVYYTLLEPVALGLKLPSSLQEEVLIYTMPIVTRAMFLIAYHEYAFGIARARTIRCLERSVYTSRGLVDHLKLGMKLIEDDEFSKTLKYKLCCFYCLEDSVDVDKPCIGNLISGRLWQDLCTETRERLRTQERVILVRIISQILYQVHDIRDSFSQQSLVGIFKTAVRSGSILAVKYSWGHLDYEHKSDLLVPNCVFVLSLIDSTYQKAYPNFLSFGNTCAPSDYYIEIMCFLISQMDGNERRDFARRDIAEHGYVTFLKYTLHWPHLKKFIEFTESIINILPEDNFLQLILQIVNKIITKYLCLTNIVVGNTGTEDYRVILREFWVISGNEHKRFFFDDIDKQEVLLTTIIGLDNFTYLDEENFKMILKDATTDEKHNIFKKLGLIIFREATIQKRFRLAWWFVKTCYPDRSTLIEFAKDLFSPDSLEATCEMFVQNMEFPDHLLKECFDSEQEISLFKKSLLSFNQQSIFYILISRDWQCFQNFMKWCFDTDEKLSAFKQEFVIDFSMVCDILICNSHWEEVEFFINWIFSTERKIQVYKRHVLLPVFGANTISKFIESGRFQEAETFVHWLKLSESEVRELKHEYVLNCKKVTSVIAILIFNIHFGSSQEDEDSEYDECSSDENCSEDSVKNPSMEYIERGIGRIEAVKLILRWLLTDERVTLRYQKLFHEQCMGNKYDNVNTDLGLGIFDQVIQEHLLDLTTKESTISQEL